MSLLWTRNPWLPELRVPDDAVVRAGAPLSGQVFEKSQSNASATQRGRRVRRRAVRAARRNNRGMH